MYNHESYFRLRIIFFIVLLLLCSRCAIASEQINLLKNKKKLSQVCVIPLLTKNSFILSDGRNILCFSNKDKPIRLDWKLHIPYVKKNHNMVISCHNGYIFFVLNNILQTLDAKTGEVIWKKELKAPIRGKIAVMNDNKLIVALTIDNCLYALDAKDGSSVWIYQNGINPLHGLYSISPVISNDKIITPFSNGELIAFNKSGKKLWSQKLATNILDTQLTDITTTPKVIDNILIATNNSYIYGINEQSGDILWSKRLLAKMF